MTVAVEGKRMIFQSKEIKLELIVDQGVHEIGPSTQVLADTIDILPHEDVLDLGCGCGVFGLLAAKRGASRVVLSDIDDQAVRCAAKNVKRNKLPNVVVVKGDFLTPFKEKSFDVMVGNLPQTPGPVNFRVDKWGGPDGSLHLLRLAREAVNHLKENGRIYFSLISLANSKRVIEAFQGCYRLTQTAEMERPFTREEYEAYWPGLFQYLEELRRQGEAEFWPAAEGFICLTRFFRADLRPGGDTRLDKH